LRRLISRNIIGTHFVSSAVVSVDKPDTQNHSESDKDKRDPDSQRVAIGFVSRSSTSFGGIEVRLGSVIFFVHATLHEEEEAHQITASSDGQHPVRHVAALANRCARHLRATFLRYGFVAACTFHLNLCPCRAMCACLW